MSESLKDQFKGHQYLTIESYRKNGDGVRTPVWFVEENGSLFVSTEKERIKYRNILRNPQVGASIDDDHPYRGVSIKGIAQLHQSDIQARVRQIVTRYVPAAELDALVAWLFKGPRVVIEIRPISVVKIGADWHAV